MKRLLAALIIIFFVVSGCGVGTPEYKDAIMDGVASLNRNKPQQALEDFNRAIQIDPLNYDGYLGRANALSSLGRYEEALTEYHKVFEIDPAIANAYINRGSVYSHLGQYKKAIADYEKGLELDPKIDNPPTFVKRLFSNEPNADKGVRRHLEYLKTQVKS